MNISCPQNLDLEWLRKHVWSETVSFDIPRQGVVRGMQVNKTSLFIEQYYIMSTHQANMFKLVLQSDNGEERIMMVKRVVPKELPAKTGDRIIIITRPKPASGRQGLVGSWGQDTDEVSTFLVFLTSHFAPAALSSKPTKNHEKP